MTLLNVEKLNLLSLAPGGHVGRFCIWTAGALSKLDALYGTWAKPSEMKTNYNLPQPTVTNSDLTKLMHSEEIQVSKNPPTAFTHDNLPLIGNNIHFGIYRLY